MTNQIDPTKRMPRGALPSPRHVLAAATPHPKAAVASPTSFLIWPTCLHYWGNDQYGDCVTAEEAFAKACYPYPPLTPIAGLPVCLSDSTVIDWASEHGFLNGAYLTDVLQAMQTGGFVVNQVTYNDGPYNSLDWTNSSALQSAIYTNGPVKIGVGAECFQNPGSGQVGWVTPGTNGWALYGYPQGQTEDHCVSLCGYGNLNDLVTLFGNQGVTVSPPNGMPTGMCYAMFTWDSIGIIDEQSMLNMTYEAWVRNPVTVVD